MRASFSAPVLIVMAPLPACALAIWAGGWAGLAAAAVSLALAFGSVRLVARPDSAAGEIKQLRHDLRGALSPALLALERLENSADPATQRAAGVIGESLDRAITRLKSG